MNESIDPQLSFLLEITASDDAPIEEMVESGAFGLESSGTKNKPQTAEVEVLVQATTGAEALEKAGLKVHSEFGDVFTGTIRIDRVPKLANLDGVELVEGARPLTPELDLAIVDTRANLVHTGPPGRRGAGVIVGIVDAGIDITHPAFRHPDGTSRILFVWDQALTPASGETSPDPYGYGVEYNKAQIDTALATSNPFSSVRHQVGAGNHGTHVAGIAAGNGRGSSQSQPEFRFIGVAPEADLVVARVGGGATEGLGTSASALDAVDYCYRRSSALGRPCAVNMSLGDNLGPHDGTSLLERGLDNLLGAPSRAFVKSAGNAGNAGQHAGGPVAHGTTEDVRFQVPESKANEIIDVWYPGGSTFRAQIIDPDGNSTGLVNPGASPSNVTLAGGNLVRIDHRSDDPFNGDRRIFVTLSRGSASQIRSGTWQLRLVSVSSAGGIRFDTWIQRPPPGFAPATFLLPHRSNDRTITTPGTAHKVITAANYTARTPGAGSFTASSSRGPTRDGRAAPTIAAPGTNVFSAASAFGGGNPYRADTGTSMSAPHITGVIALMFQKNPNQTQEQIRECLTSTARADAFTGPVPNTAWGAGKVDAQEAVRCVPGIVSPRTVVEPHCRQITVVEQRCQLATVVEVRCLRPPVTVVGPQCPVTVPATCPPRSLPFHCLVPTTPLTCLPQTSPLTCQPQTSPLTCGPSVVDGCPSTPGGCDPMTVVINPGWTGVGVRPPVAQPMAPIGMPETFGREVEQAALVAAHTAYWDTLHALMETRAVETGGVRGEVPLPAEGYHEYDESWFDDDGSGSEH
jgi:subtilisin family serine protease